MTAETSDPPAANVAGSPTKSPEVADDSGKSPILDASSANETRVEIKKPDEAEPSCHEEFKALTKSELMKYASDPFWVTLRWVLFILFWVAWVAMLVAAVVIIVMAPKCPTPAPKEWWQKAPVYQVYVKSFKDSNGDSFGDLKGIEEKVDYLEALGVGSVLLSQIYNKEDADPIKDFKAIDATYGTLEDFKSLVSSLKSKGLKLILDFVPEAGKIKDDTGRAELETAMNFWLDLDVDGFKVSVDADGNHAQIMDTLKELRGILNKKTAADIYNPKILMTSATGLDVSELVKYYGDEEVVEVDDLSEKSTLAQIPVNFKLVDDVQTPSLIANELRSSIENYTSVVPSWAWANFQLGNADSGRIASRVGSQLVDAMNMISMLLPGTPITYYGEELGMVNGQGSDNKAYRTPMQWTNESQGGFSSASPWLAVNPDLSNNVASQLSKSSVGLNSHAAIYSYLANLRLNEAILFGSMEFFNNTESDSNLFGFVRVKKGNPGTLVLVNFGDAPLTADLSKMKYIPERGTVQVRSVYNPETYVDEGKTVDFTSIKIQSKEGLVIAFVPKFG